MLRTTGESSTFQWLTVDRDGWQYGRNWTGVATETVEVLNTIFFERESVDELLIVNTTVIHWVQLKEMLNRCASE